MHWVHRSSEVSGSKCPGGPVFSLLFHYSGNFVGRCWRLARKRRGGTIQGAASSWPVRINRGRPCGSHAVANPMTHGVTEPITWCRESAGSSVIPGCHLVFARPVDTGAQVPKCSVIWKYWGWSMARCVQRTILFVFPKRETKRHKWYTKSRA